MPRITLTILTALLVASCGGGGGQQPPAINQPPSITSAAAVSVPENAAGIVYQATATDPDGTPVTFRIEGTDVARFTIDGSGAIRFAAAPNFEAPADADANNVYQIVLVASDSSAESRLPLSITVTNLPDQLSARRVGTFANFVAPVPGTSSIFAGYRIDALNGSRSFNISVIDPAPGGAEFVYLTISDIFIPQFDSEYGVLNIVAAPDYATSGFLYVLVTNPNRDIELRRYGRLPSGLGNPTGDVILRIPWNGVGNSESLGGGLAFGPDNLLYIGIGEGRSVASNPDLTAQDLSSLRGKILRIDVGRDDFPADPNRDYGIPAGNPVSTGAREILAYGFDNPRRMSFDGPSLLIGDAHGRVAAIERPRQEINLWVPQQAGANYGYPFGVPGLPPPPPGTIPPVIRLEGSAFSNQGRITGGYVYRGPVAQFSGQYIFADMVTRTIWSVSASQIVQGQTITDSGLTSLNAVLPPEISREVQSFGIDSLNNLYFVTPTIYVIELR